MIALAAALAIGSPFPFGLIHGPMGKPGSANNYKGRFVAVIPGCDQALAAKFAGLQTDARLDLMPLFSTPKGMMAGDGFEQAVGAGSMLLVNPQGYLVHRWPTRDPLELKEWLEGTSLNPGTVAPNPYVCLRPLPTLPATTSLGNLIAYAANLKNPAPARTPKGAKGFLVFFLSSRSAADGIYADRIAKIQAKCRESAIATLAIFSNFDETAPDAAVVGQKLGLACALDPGSAFADAYRATRTPEVFLMDGGWKVVYTGAIDSSTWEDAGSVRYLENALSAFSQAASPKIAQTMPFGNLIRRTSDR